MKSKIKEIADILLSGAILFMVVLNILVYAIIIPTVTISILIGIIQCSL